MNDDYVRAVLKAGRDLGVTERGIVIAFATVYVESNWLNYANYKVPDSLKLPHDAIGSDGFSVGLFQQQVVMGNGWWWGDAATCMSPYKSALLFFQRLKKLDYNNTTRSPGSYAQAVQQSAFPDRYDERMADAQALYDRIAGDPPPQGDTAMDPNRPDFNEFPAWLSANYHERDPGGVDLFLIHTQEGGGGNDAALDLRNFQESTTNGPNPVSYHYTGSQADDGGTTVVDCVDTDDASWSVGNSNDRSINFCFAGSRSNWTREQWLAQRGVIAAAAYIFVRDSKKYPKLQARVIAPDYSAPPGAADHNYCTKFLRDGNTHTDVGPNFPWDVFKADVSKYAASGSDQPQPSDPAAPQPTDDTPADPEREVLAQTRGRWEMLGGQTLIEALAQVRDKVCGTADAGKPGFRW